MLGELTVQQIESFLKREIVGRIGCLADNKVLVVPITYVYQNGYLYGHSRDGQKIEAMRKNPNVCFEVDKMADLANWESVMLWGVYEEMKTEEETASVMKILKERIMPLTASETMRPAQRMPEPHPHNIGVKAIAFRIKVVEETGRFERVT